MKSTLCLVISMLGQLAFASENNFICVGSQLYSSSKGYIAEAGTSSECLSSIASSKNNFICVGSQLFSAEHGYIAEAGSSSECLSAIATSK